MFCFSITKFHLQMQLGHEMNVKILEAFFEIGLHSIVRSMAEEEVSSLTTILHMHRDKT